MKTRNDVATYAGVSKTTVSRVINNNGYVSPENRKKVEDAIKALGYTPNLIARSLKTKETRQILFYADELSNPFYLEVYQGMEDYAEKHGYTIVVSSHMNHQVIRQRQFDGIILFSLPDDCGEELLSLGIPIVVTSYSNQPLAVPSVGIDVEDGAIKAMEYLIGLGHTKIAFLANSNDKMDLRYQGFVKGLSGLGLGHLTGSLVFTSSSMTYYQRGYDAAMELMKKTPDITALFAFNDAMAIGAISALTGKGIQIPKDVSVIGFDDILQASFTVPPLTTIHIPKYEQGWESARMLLKAIKGEAAQDLTLKTGLVERHSVLKLNK